MASKLEEALKRFEDKAKNDPTTWGSIDDLINNYPERADELADVLNKFIDDVTRILTTKGEESK